MVYSKGINDMQRGWMSENEWNKRVYRTWSSMLCRCYYDKYHEKYPTYIGCSVCEKWLYLSNFIKDFKSIDNYDEEKFLKGELCLDKDVKSNGKNKEYSLENCILVSIEENAKQAIKTRNNDYLQGKNNPMYGKIGKDNLLSIKTVQCDKQGNFIKIWDCIKDVERELGIDTSSISKCCQFCEINCNKEEWFKVRKDYPRKSAGGFIWRYYKK